MKNREAYPPLGKRELESGRTKIPVDYPTQKLVIPEKEWKAMVKNGEIVIEEGPWSVTQHAGRNHPKNKHLVEPFYTEDNPMSENQIKHWHGLGLLTDTAGRPLHPRAEEVLPTIGMFTQPGAHYGYGPQLIGNFGLRRVRRDIVEYATVGVGRDELDASGNKRIRRSMPGGYAGKGELAQDAASRELHEELGIRVDTLGSVSVRQVVIPPHPFWKNTLHAWTREEFTFALSDDNPELEGVEIDIQDTKEVLEARWMTVEEIIHDPDFLGAHRKQIEANEAMFRN